MNQLDFITDAELSQKLGITTRTIRDWRDKRKIPFIKIGHVIRFRESDVARALERFVHKEAA